MEIVYSITVCSLCKKRIYGVMGRTMNTHYYEDADDPKTHHTHQEPWAPIIELREEGSA